VVEYSLPSPDSAQSALLRNTPRGLRLKIAFEQFKPDYLLWGPLRSSFASSSTPAGCLLKLKHGLDEAARGAKSGCKKSY
jgi:hypothetical protein